MDRVFRKLYILNTLCIISLFGCTTKDSIDTENVFEMALISDSLSYYFPPTLSDTFKRENPFQQDIAQRYYSSTLYTFNEPILFNKSDSQTIYRILWLRSFDQPVCFSMKQFKGRYFLNTKTLDRIPEFYATMERYFRDANNRKPAIDTIQQADSLPLINFNTIKVLTSGQWNQIENYLAKLDFWEGPISDPNDQNSTDGANWIIEGRKAYKYHFIDRRNENRQLFPLGKYLIKLSRLNIKDDSIY